LARHYANFPQDTGNGMVFDKRPPSSNPPAKPYLHPHSTEVEPIYTDLLYRQGFKNEVINDTNYHGSQTFKPKPYQELWKQADRDVGEKKAAAAAQMSLWGGGKRKSKRKQKRSQKQKKSRKQRR
jgi:hypothetical protein